LLIRHGESEGNRERIFTPTPAVPLTDLGRSQVAAAARWIATRYAPTRIVSSPFTRARQTAEILAAALEVPVSVEDDLRERSYGELAGRPYATARTTPGWDPALYWEWCPPGDGESLVAVAVRAGAALDRIARHAGVDDTVVVSHGAVMHALWRHVTGEWRTGRVARNAGIMVVRHEQDRYLEAFAVEEG
jgi:probable phosphoglycerate mutase